METPEPQARPARDESKPGGELRRQLDLIDAVAIFIGIILGSGIFVAPKGVAAAAPSPFVAALVWLAGAAVALCGAFCYAECAARLPRAGGFFVFYRAAYGDALAFVAGWTATFVTYPASIAAIAHVGAAYLAELLPSLSPRASLVAAVAIVLAGSLNALGVRLGAWAQRILTAAKVGALLVLVAAALLAGGAAPSEASPAAAGLGIVSWTALLGAAAWVMWTYDGWSDVTLIAGEVRDPARNLGRAVLLGLAVLVVVYLSAQLSVMHLLGATAAAASTRPVAEAAEAGLGTGAGSLVAALVVVSTFGAVNAALLTCSRVPYAMARARLAPALFAAVHSRFGTPARSVLALTGTTMVYAFVAEFRNLVGLFTFAVWIFYSLTAVAMLLLRRRRVGEPLAWRAPGGLVPPAVVIAVGAAMTSSLFLDDPKRSAIGLAVLLAGFPAYALVRALRR